MEAAALDDLFRELEERSALAGQPVTVQRRVALKVLAGRGDHPTADVVYEDVVAELPGVSRATVYRALDNLVRLGLARKVDHEGSVGRYDANLERHHHLFCLRCGSISDVDWETLDAIPAPNPPEGFLIRDFSVNFRGLCRDCARREPRAPTQET